MTGMHALHMIIGCGLFGTLAVLAWKGKYTPGYYTPVKTLACTGTWSTLFGFICSHCCT